MPQVCSAAVLTDQAAWEIDIQSRSGVGYCSDVPSTLAVFRLRTSRTFFSCFRLNKSFGNAALCDHGVIVNG